MLDQAIVQWLIEHAYETGAITVLVAHNYLIANGMPEEEARKWHDAQRTARIAEAEYKVRTLTEELGP